MKEEIILLQRLQGEFPSSWAKFPLQDLEEN